MIFSKKIKLLGLLIGLFCCPQLLAQNGSNPFELEYRAEKKAKVSGLTDVVEQPDLAAENPFNVVRTPENKIAATSIASTKKKKVDTAKSTGKVDDKNFRFWLTLIMLTLLALILSIYKSQVGRAYRAFSNENVMRMLHREKGTATYTPYYILYFLFIFNAGVFAYLLMRYFEIGNNIPNLNLLGYTTGGVAILFFLKHLVIGMLGSIFPIGKETSFYNMTITIFGIVLSVVLFVANVVIAYAPTNIVLPAIYFTLILIGIVYLFRSFRGLSIAAKFLNHNKFHFFIYLCTVEIAPVLILWKMTGNGIGIQ